MTFRSGKQFWLILGAAIAVVVLVGGAIVLVTIARVQQANLAKEPQYDAATLASLGSQQLQKGDYAAAEKSLEKALTSDTNLSAKLDLAVVKYQLKKYQESITLYEGFTTGTGNPAAFAWNGIGNAQRDWADADPAQKDAHNQSALDAYSKSIATDSKNVAAYTNLALLNEKLGNHSGAVSVLTAGIAATNSADLQETLKRISK